MKPGVCYVVGAGEHYNDPIHPTVSDMVIAADAGYRHLQKLNVKPHYILGDFDSMEVPKDFDNIIRHPSEKNDTDMMLAVKLGLRHGFRTFALYGGSGGRPDHTFANLQVLCMLSKNQSKGFLVGKDHIVTVLTNGSLTFPSENDAYGNSPFWLPKQKGYLSIFSFGETAKGVTLEGFKYPLNQATLTNDVPLGVSNEFTGRPAQITIEAGSLLIVWEK